MMVFLFLSGSLPLSSLYMYLLCSHMVSKLLSLSLSLSSVILIDSSTESPVHVLTLSIQAVRDLPRLRAPGIVPCIISSNSLVSSWCDHSTLASLL